MTRPGPKDACEAHCDALGALAPRTRTTHPHPPSSEVALLPLPKQDSATKDPKATTLYRGHRRRITSTRRDIEANLHALEEALGGHQIRPTSDGGTTGQARFRQW